MPEVKLGEASLIAVVDDDQFVRESMKRLLSSLGFTVEAFVSAADFLGSVRLRETACLISDMQMAEMSGLELHARLLESRHVIPTILITAYPDETVMAQALNNGVDGYLVKPFREDELIAYIRSALAKSADED
jgi:FixJ family two-component response regulator